MDRDTVINRIETICSMCKENTWRTEFSSDIIYPLLCDALELMKEQEKERLAFVSAIGKLTAENEMLKMIYGNPGEIVGELIRCKDCKHYNSDKKWCQHMEVANGGKWFCADGERRE